MYLVMQEVEQKKYKARQKRELCTEQMYGHGAGMEEQITRELLYLLRDTC